MEYSQPKFKEKSLNSMEANSGTMRIAERLDILRQWQENQKKILQEHQQTQRELFDVQHGQLLQDIHQGTDKELDFKHQENISEPCISFKPGFNKIKSNLFDFDTQNIQLIEPEPMKTNKLVEEAEFIKTSNQPEYYEPVNDGFEETEQRPRSYLRRGQGLSRFGMNQEDFKKRPAIYKKIKIRPPPVTRPGVVSKNQKTEKPKAKPKREVRPATKPNKQNPQRDIPVTIVAPVKTRPNNPPKNPKVAKALTKTPIEKLVLKPIGNIGTEWYNNLRRQMSTKNSGTESRLEDQLFSPSTQEKMEEMDKSMKRNEKELKIFEKLEEKVEDQNFNINISQISDLANDTLSSTPQKERTNRKLQFDRQNPVSYSEALEHLHKFYADQELQLGHNEDIVKENISPIKSLSFDKDIQKTVPLPPKDQIVQFAENVEVVNNLSFGENDSRTELEESLAEEKDYHTMTQKEIASTVRRKALQDNVKNILGWENVNVKKPIKKVRKKIIKPKKIRLKKNEEAVEDVVMTSTVLKQKLEELEQEIAIFKKNNKSAEKAKAMCKEEEIRLGRERKEFEKRMLEEREEFEGKMQEERKKLQRDRMVFEKYCKEKKQPDRKEREEINSLKKELQDITNLYSSKEAKWGALQARLRNQLKTAEKEIQKLKEENETLKKQTMKKVSFEKNKTYGNTKFINKIGEHLGFGKQSVGSLKTYKQKYQSLSARVDSNVPKKKILRRTKSVPVMTESERDMEEHLENSRSEELTGVGCYLNEQEEAEEEKEENVSLDEENEPALAVYETLYNQEFSSNLLNIKKRLAEINLVEESATQERENRIDGEKQSLSIRELSPDQSIIREMEETDQWRASSERQDRQSTENEATHCGKQLNYQLRDRAPVQTSNRYDLEYGTTSCESEDSYSRYKPKDYGCIDKGMMPFEKLNEDGTRETHYSDGRVKKTSSNGNVVRMIYTNGDVQEKSKVEGVVKYFYAETKTWQITYADGLEVFEFANGQTERRFRDGSKNITFPNGSVLHCLPDGSEELRTVDGSVVKTDVDGSTVMLMSNGQREVHTKDHKRREYPDGTVKIVYKDGSEETRYSTGRIRLKDKHGNLLMDSGGFS